MTDYKDAVTRQPYEQALADLLRTTIHGHQVTCVTWHPRDLDDGRVAYELTYTCRCGFRADVIEDVPFGIVQEWHDEALK